MKRLFTFAAFLFISGCSSFYQQFDQQGLTQLVGKEESEVTKKLGTPTQVIVEKDKKKLIYQTNYKTYSNPERQTYLNPSADQQGTYFNHSCQTTFIIQKNIVSSIQRNGNCL